MKASNREKLNIVIGYMNAIEDMVRADNKTVADGISEHMDIISDVLFDEDRETEGVEDAKQC